MRGTMKLKNRLLSKGWQRIFEWTCGLPL